VNGNFVYLNAYWHTVNGNWGAMDEELGYLDAISFIIRLHFPFVDG